MPTGEPATGPLTETLEIEAGRECVRVGGWSSVDGVLVAVLLRAGEETRGGPRGC